MKTKLQIEFKIMIHESKINEILELNREEWNDRHVELIDTYLKGRTALLWVLSPDDFIKPDDFEKQAKFECICHDSTKIF
jgi:hypothetical protein